LAVGTVAPSKLGQSMNELFQPYGLKCKTVPGYAGSMQRRMSWCPKKSGRSLINPMKCKLNKTVNEVTAQNEMAPAAQQGIEIKNRPRDSTVNQAPQRR